MTTRHTLDPKLDVVFKLLFAKPSNKRLLIALVTAILEPTLPIADAEVLNPDVTKDSVETKGVVLDVLVLLADGRRVNLEMQATAQGWSMARGLFYCARVYASQLSRGDDYSQLNPVVGIFILDFRADFKALAGERYHSTFELLEVHSHVRLTHHLAIHVIELPKLPEVVPAMNAPAVLKWSKFLAARDDEELERVAMSDPDLREAKTALEELSRDPAARRLAEERRLAALNYRLSMAQEREEGREEGRTETLRSNIEQLCRMLGIAMTETRRACLHAATPDEAQAIFDHLVGHRTWPE